MQHYRKLLVWQRSHKLVLATYQCSRSFPSEECYGLTSQRWRAALSVPTNIAEGSKRSAPKDYAHFLNIAEGSLSETEYLLVVCRDLGYLNANLARTYLAEATELLKMLHALRKTVRNDSAPRPNSKTACL
jgi:four helix bundle protein